jgi:hypothetical protein
MSYSKPQYSITYRRPERLVELTWLPETQSMTDQDFKDGILAFAECALQHSARRLIIDMREFRYRPSPEAQVIRDEVVVPKYVKAGVKKIAWIWPGESGDKMTETPNGSYENRYVDTVDEAFAWLTAKG